MLNARETRWRDHGPLGVACTFEGKRPFRELGLNLNVLAPGHVWRSEHAAAGRRASSAPDGEARRRLCAVPGVDRTAYAAGWLPDD